MEKYSNQNIVMMQKLTLQRASEVAGNVYHNGLFLYLSQSSYHPQISTLCGRR